MWLRDEPPPPEVLNGCRERGLTIVHSGCMPSLGSFIGTDDALIARRARAMMPTYSHIISGIIALHTRGRTQQAALLLRYCAISQPAYLLRTLPPAVSHSLCVAFDTAIQHACCTLFDLPSPLPAEALIDLHLPFRFGGCGFRPTVRTSRAGFWAAAAAALPIIISSMHQDTVLRDLPLVHHLRTLQPDALWIAEGSHAPHREEH